MATKHEGNRKWKLRKSIVVLPETLQALKDCRDAMVRRLGLRKLSLNDTMDMLLAADKRLYPRPRCRSCGNLATCIGEYEGHGGVGPSCDTCCGHGNEDGYCRPIRRHG